MHCLSTIISNFIRATLAVALMGIRPLLGPPARCYFYPSCTQFAYHQITTQPLIRALKAIVWQLLQCNPFGRYINSLANLLSSLRSLSGR